MEKSIVRCYGTHLRAGDVIDLGPGDGHCIVEMVNECRARVRPLRKVEIEFTPVTTGKKVSFIRHTSAFNISPNTEAPIVKRGKRSKNFSGELQR
jgi:hypothetical protein